MKYRCLACGYIYDDEKEDVPFSELPADWICPLCGASKDMFEPIEEKKKDQVFEVNNNELNEIAEIEELREMTTGEISALCSSLAKGCEKQYLEKEAQDFYKLADYFEKKANTSEKNNFEVLISKINEDLESNFVNARNIATDKKDRGALRVITWGEKVTMILKSLLTQYERDKNFTQNVKIYVCDICGFIYVGNQKPEICPICKVPSFKLLEVERGA